MSNPIQPTDASYVGLYYAVEGLGGYVMEEGLATITLIPIGQLTQFDVTESLQIMYDVKKFNQKLGTFDTDLNQFQYDSIEITAPDFVEEMTEAKVISVGKLQFLYSDFIMYVDEYFAYANGFSTLFNLSAEPNFNNGIFDASAFIYIINGHSLNPDTGEYVLDLSGSIKINNIKSTIDYVIYSNAFNNRDPSSNYTLQDGFIEGDLIFVPNGITITLNLNIVTNNIYLNNLGIEHTNDLTNSVNYSDGYFSSNTTNTQTQITRVVKAPMLIKLMNFS